MPGAVWNSPGLAHTLTSLYPNHFCTGPSAPSLEKGVAGLIKEIKRPEVVEIREDAAVLLRFFAPESTISALNLYRFCIRIRRLN